METNRFHGMGLSQMQSKHVKTYLDISAEEWIAKNCTKEAWIEQITKHMPPTLRYDAERNIMIEINPKQEKLRKKLKKKKKRRK